MGVKGRRVHMIEEMSDTIISFQRGIHPHYSPWLFINWAIRYLYNFVRCRKEELGFAT